MDRIKSVVGKVPGVNPLRALRYERYFARTSNPCFRGIFETFDEAKASAPRRRGVGFDQDVAVEEFADRQEHVFAYDYPILFWLRPLLQSCASVFDWGGHLGVHYHAYARYLTYPSGLTWTVCEVPKIVAAARSRAGLDAALTFTSDVRKADGKCILLTAGALQYIESPSLPELLRSLATPPAHLLINKVPLYEGPAFVTLQNVGFGYSPCRVWNRAEILNQLQVENYELVDSWEDPECTFHLPFHPERSFASLSGMYLRRRNFGPGD